MASMSRNQKDKPHSAGPKLKPRPTAASTARAARNATNRNLLVAAPKQSPTRQVEYKSTKAKSFSAGSSNIQMTDSKLSLKSIQQIISEVEHIEHVPNSNVEPPGERCDVGGTNSTILIIEDSECKMEHNIENENHENYAPTNQIESDVGERGDETNKRKIFSKVEYNGDSVPHSPRSSRPGTPQKSSRPQTPRLPSRPSTPRGSSLPLTPAHSISRPNTPNSRPMTPVKAALFTGRSISPSSISTQQTRGQSNSLSMQHNTQSFSTKDMKAYVAKQKKFHQMKKELDFKQQEVLDLFENIREIEDSLTREGTLKPSESTAPRELVVYNVADWATEEISQLCREFAADSSINGVGDIFNNISQADDKYFSQVTSKVNDVPIQFADLCIQAFTMRQETIDWMKDYVSLNGGGEAMKKIAEYNSQGLELCETLRELKIRADAIVNSATHFSKQTYQERSLLIATGEALLREVEKLRAEQNYNMTNQNGQESGESVMKALEESQRELDDERNARATMKDKLAVSESQLRSARTRISKMDKQLRESETTIASLTGTVKSLEEQSRQREGHLEARARKLRDSLKTGEVASTQLAQQRDALVAENQELKETIIKLTTQHKQAVQELNEQMKNLKTALEEQMIQTNEELKLKQEAQKTICENVKQIDELNERINELNNKFNTELPSEREMDLWAELQATKETLHATEEEVHICKKEKVRFLETLTKITESDNKVGIQQKLAAELMSKEEIIGKMQSQIRELTKNTKHNEQKVMQYEQYVRDLQAYTRANVNCEEGTNGVTYQSLQQEMMTLRIDLLESAHRNEGLQELLMQREQQLEVQDKTSRSQAKVIKVREELINMLKNKETEQSRELTALQHDLEHRMKIVDDVNKQIAAKADEIQKLFATLETKQQQIHRLEKIVVALEEQQTRAQTQRVRHEQKIAELEHTLANGGNRRERESLRRLTNRANSSFVQDKNDCTSAALLTHKKC